MMRPDSRFSQGQVLKGIVQRILDGDRLFVQIEGNFLFVSNGSSHKFRVGEQVELLVDSTAPLVLKVRRNNDEVSRYLDLNI